MALTEASWDTALNRSNSAALRSEAPEDDVDWMQVARAAYDDSTSFLNANQRTPWETAYRHFLNRHAGGSKYHSESYRHRSRIFRPKTRSAVRKGEAACAAAFFSTMDVVNVTAENDADPMQLASAGLMHEILNYRLTKTVPWFLTCVGAYQDTDVVGVCISKQYWAFEEEETGTELVADVEGPEPVIDETGTIEMIERPITQPVRDEPVIELIAPENLRIDQSADWMRPIETSPYLIHLIPMYVGDVKARMKQGAAGKTGQAAWKTLSDGQIAKAMEPDEDSIRQAREGDRQDAYEDRASVRNHQIVWVHENFIRWDGEDWQFFTLGTEALLTEPRPAMEAYPRIGRPFVMGYSNVEAHKTYPTSKVTLTSELQKETNEITNQRLDNVKLALNGRYFVRTGRSTDLAALRRSVPGGVVLTENPTDDIRWERPQDVTASSFQEQDRLNIEFDDLAGAFSPSSVASNRKLNETVGGMNLLSNSASAISEYDLRVFTETWVEPVMRQLVLLEQMYETDTVVLGLAADKARLRQKFGIDRITDELLENQLTINVNVGIGAQDPQTQLQRFMFGLQALGEIAQNPMAARYLNIEEAIKEIFGKLGYRDGMRFFNFEGDPQVQMLQDQMQQMKQAMDEMQAELEDKKADRQAKVQIAQIGAQADLTEQEMQGRQELEKTGLEGQIRLIAENVKAESAEKREMMKSIANSIERLTQEVQRLESEQQRLSGNGGGDA